MEVAIIDDLNQYRSKHEDTPNLEWNIELATKAQTRAEKVRDEYLASDGSVPLKDIASNGEAGEKNSGEIMFFADETAENFHDEMENYVKKANQAWYKELKESNYD
eukprot:UN03727